MREFSEIFFLMLIFRRNFSHSTALIKNIHENLRWTGQKCYAFHLIFFSKCHKLLRVSKWSSTIKSKAYPNIKLFLDALTDLIKWRRLQFFWSFIIKINVIFKWTGIEFFTFKFGDVDNRFFIVHNKELSSLYIHCSKGRFDSQLLECTRKCGIFGCLFKKSRP